jgi:branched-chain amino acid transport system ATP-binding protein
VVQRIARDAIVLDQGRVVHRGDARALLADTERVRRFLGVASEEGA